MKGMSYLKSSRRTEQQGNPIRPEPRGVGNRTLSRARLQEVRVTRGFGVWTCRRGAFRARCQTSKKAAATKELLHLAAAWTSVSGNVAPAENLIHAGESRAVLDAPGQVRAGGGEPDPPFHGEEPAVGEVEDAGPRRRGTTPSWCRPARSSPGPSTASRCRVPRRRVPRLARTGTS